MSSAEGILGLTNSQRRCVHCVGKFGFWDTQSIRHRKECIDLGLMKWDDGAKLTPKGEGAYRLLCDLARTTGSYLPPVQSMARERYES